MAVHDRIHVPAQYGITTTNCSMSFARHRDIVSNFRQVFLHQLSEHTADFVDGDDAALSSQHGAINVPVGTGMLEHCEAECQRPIPLTLSRFSPCGFQLTAKPLEAAA